MVYPKDRHLHEIPPGLNRLISLDAIKTESPFAPSRCYLSEGSFSCYLNRHYPVLITRTGSCARPNSSRRLRVNYYNGSLQVVTSPCWKMVLPDVIPAILA